MSFLRVMGGATGHRAFDVRRTHCSNCGQTGHLFRNCMLPVTSYGIIAMRCVAPSGETIGSIIVPLPRNDPSSTRGAGGLSRTNSGPAALAGLQFLLVRRRDSLAFIEFVRGKYNLNEKEYLASLLQGMSQAEQTKLHTQTFDELWRSVWGDAAGTHRMDYEISERKYRQLAPLLPALLAENPSPWSEPEWGFPKGRRNPYESDLAGATREFMEETGLKRGDFKVIQNVEPLVETFFGSNGVQYCHKYYIAFCSPTQTVAVDASNPHMAREIGDIGWFTLEEALAKIRPESVEKRELVLKVGRILRNFCPVEI